MVTIYNNNITKVFKINKAKETKSNNFTINNNRVTNNNHNGIIKILIKISKIIISSNKTQIKTSKITTNNYQTTKIKIY